MRVIGEGCGAKSTTIRPAESDISAVCFLNPLPARMALHAMRPVGDPVGHLQLPDIADDRLYLCPGNVRQRASNVCRPASATVESSGTVTGTALA
jgi:hypothetical protein